MINKMSGTIPLRKEIRVALRAKQREGGTPQQTEEQAKQGMVAIGSKKGWGVLKRSRERLVLSRRLMDSNEIYPRRMVRSGNLGYVLIALQIYTKAETVFLR